MAGVSPPPLSSAEAAGAAVTTTASIAASSAGKTATTATSRLQSFFTTAPLPREATKRGNYGPSPTTTDQFRPPAGYRRLCTGLPSTTLFFELVRRSCGPDASDRRSSYGSPCSTVDNTISRYQPLVKTRLPRAVDDRSRNVEPGAVWGYVVGLSSHQRSQLFRPEGRKQWLLVAFGERWASSDWQREPWPCPPAPRWRHRRRREGLRTRPALPACSARAGTSGTSSICSSTMPIS